MDKHWTGKLYDQQFGFETGKLQGLARQKIFYSTSLSSTYLEGSKVLFQQELRSLVDKTLAQQSKLQQFESGRFQDLREAARHLGATPRSA